jgi:hypothetical protein
MGNRSRRFKANGKSGIAAVIFRHTYPLTGFALMARKIPDPGTVGVPDGRLVQPALQGML